MDEQRLQAYVNLIEQLLGCATGEELAVLQQHTELVDAGLLAVMAQMADLLEQQGNPNAGWLRQFAEKLRAGLAGEDHGTPNAEPRQASLAFLAEVLKRVGNSQGDARQVYPFLAEHQHQLNETLLQVMPIMASSFFDSDPDQQALFAGIFANFGSYIYSFPLGKRAVNLELAITAYQLALQVYTRRAFPEQWAMTQNAMAVAYRNRIQGNRADNLEQAITAYQLALQVYTRRAFPEQWAMTQNNLSNAYRDRLRGDRADNLEQAIAAAQLALQVRTREAFPEQWARTQDNLANAYCDRIRGDRADNLEQAITAYQLVLQVRTREAFPEDWATTQNNLAIAYRDRIRGDRADNMEQALATAHSALQVYTREAFPEYWAMTQNNLAIAYRARIQGDRVDNLEQAISAFQLALQIYTREAFPEQWAATQNNLALAYHEYIQSDRADSLEKEIATAQLLLQSYTREASPEQWAEAQYILAAAYRQRIQGDRADNLEQAISASQLALQIYTHEAFPEQWAAAQYILACAYLERIRGDRANNLEQSIAACQLTLQVKTREAFPADWAMTQNILAQAYMERIQGDRADNLEQAIATHQLALQVRTREAFPTDWAMTQNNLANAYRQLIRGDRADNLEQAIATYQLALQVYTYEAFPKDWAMTKYNLAVAYSERIRGDRADNLEQSIAAAHLALQVYTREAFPELWATTQNILAAGYSNRIRGNRADNLEQAIAAYQSALQVFTREAFPELWARAQNNLAGAYFGRIQGDRADNLEQAISAYQSALQVRTREAFPEKWAMIQNNLANAFRDRIRGDRADNLEQAIAASQLALQVRTREAFPQQWAGTQNTLAVGYSNRIRGDRADNLEQAIAASQLALQIYTHEAFPQECRMVARRLGNLYFEQQRWTDSTAPYEKALQAADILYQNALFLDSQAAELSETSDLHHRAAYALAKAGELPDAVLTLEQGRARNLSDTLARDRADLEQLQKRNPALYTQYQDITNQLRNLETQQRLRMTSDDRHNLTPEALRTEASRLRQTLTEIIDQIRQVSGYEDFLAQPSFEDIRQALRPGIPLVYLVPTSAGSLALIVTQDDITPLWLDDLTETRLREILITWLNAYDQSPANRPAWLDAIDQGTRQLWEPLMAPLIDHFKHGNFQQATLIPTGYLSFLPLHAAWTEASTAPTGRHYALDAIHFTYAPNARSLSTAQDIAQRTVADSILAIDNPRNDLPNSTREVTAAVATFPQHKVLQHDQATIESVLAALPDYNVLHLSCHGIANLSEPLTSGLVMSDGLLTLRDILDLKLDGIRLAILSACETGLAGIELADEAISLPTGLLQAGVAGVAASLWSVSDLSTMMLLTRFYDLWRIEGLEIDQALRQAQQWVRDTTNGEKVAYFKAAIPELATAKLPGSIASFLYQSVRLSNPKARDFAHPFHWAAFQYVGV